jgi:glycosyltransferase involved in cell wall biosynthesis
MYQTIGIVVPYFENHEYFSQLVESVIAQDSSSWFLTIVDDSGGSEPVVLRSEVAQDTRIDLVVNKNNRGLGKSWNIGLERMKSRNNPDIMAVIHADDELESNYVSTVLAAHRANPDVVAVHTEARIIDEQGSYRFSFPDFIKRFIRPGAPQDEVVSRGDAALSRILRGNFVFCPTLSFKTAMCDFPLFDEKWTMAIDLDLISRLLLSGKTILGVSDKVYRYRRHGGNLTSRLNKSTERFSEEINFYAQISSMCERRGFSSSARVAQRMWIVKLHILYQLARSCASGNFGLMKKLLVVLKDSFLHSSNIRR